MNDLLKGTQPARQAVKEATTPGLTGGSVAFANDEGTRAVIQAVCQSRQDRLILKEGGSREALEYASRYALPHLLIVDVSDADRPLDSLSPILAAADENTRIIAIGALNDITLYREMTEAGVVDYLVKPLTDRALIAAIQRAEERHGTTKGGAVERSRLIAVIGARGGVGASTVAANLAWYLAEQFKRRTVLLDLDLQFGTGSLAFDAEPSRGLREALEQPNRIDALLINGATFRQTERLSILAAEESHEEDVRYDPAAITLLLEELGRQGDFVVIDLPRFPAGYRAKVLPLVREVVIVTDLSLAGLRDSIRLCTQAQQLQPSARLSVVASRSGTRANGVSVREFEKALGHKLSILLPEDAKAVSQATVEGKPLAVSARSSKLTAGLRELANQLNDAKPKGKAIKSSLWWWLRKG
ncbi:MAG: pilus assembly protein CpaE [Rhodospirillaceae bacterium]|nr:pilus assembly protein CpaE [Rhodospirillaceae bacterium]